MQGGIDLRPADTIMRQLPMPFLFAFLTMS
jgi:hypothetical protein